LIIWFRLTIGTAVRFLEDEAWLRITAVREAELSWLNRVTN
jgi:hypothetical protein